MGILQCQADPGRADPIWEIIEDTNSDYELDSVLVMEDDFASEEQIFNFGYTTSTYWFRTSISSLQPEYLIVDNSLIRYLEFYLVRDGKVVRAVKTEFLRDTRTGELAFETPHIRFPDDFVDGQLVIKAKGTDLLLLPFRWMTIEDATRFLESSKAPAFIMIGAILALIVLYTIFFLSLRLRVYAYYLLYAIAAGISVLKFNGLFFSRIPQFDFLYDYTAIFQVLPAIAAGVFTLVFLNLKQYNLLFYRIVLGLILLQCLSLLIALLGYNHVSYMLTDGVASIFIPLAISIGWSIWRREKYRAARYYLISWLFVFTGAFMYWLRSYFSIGVDQVIFKHAIELGITFEMSFLAYGLSKIVEGIRKEKELLQEENIRILESANQELESKVGERTAEISTKNGELKKRNEELQVALDRLQATQQQLVRSEKMASLGLLSSGISHEINNPLNFIKNGKEVIIKELDKEQSRGLINNQAWTIMDEGIRRISAIVSSLSQFSLQTDKMDESCNLEDIVENCLIILNSRIRAEVEVQKEYSLEGSRLQGNEGKLHQAIFNVLNNALDAMENRGHPFLLIRTYAVGNLVCLMVKDNGTGIPKEDLQKVADPFFTTKPPGRGTGLGLSITYSIVREHDGDVEVNSEPGKGTTISIYLPGQSIVPMSASN
jgi:signal transduction histidine kinase